MTTRSTRRVYNASALERWFENVAFEWEVAFSKEVLREGRSIYREGLISGLELSGDEAIIHCSFSRKDTCYSVIEWGSKGPSVRASTEDRQIGWAVAVAGLYEIEELIADEIAPLPYEPGASKRQSAAEAERRFDRKEEATEEKRKGRQGNDEIKDQFTCRSLCPVFKGGASGLILVADWISPDGGREPALKKSNKRELTETEREALVRLTGLARAAGFVFRNRQNDFLLSDAERISVFLSDRLKSWKIAFGQADLDSEARRMAEGVKKVKLVARVQRADGDRLRLKWAFKSGARWLDSDAAELLIRRGRGTHLIKGHGLIRINDEQSDALNEWQTGAASDDNTWPRYMVFSLFREQSTEVDMDEELADWRDVIQKGGGDGATLPLPEFLRPYQSFGVSWLSNLRKHACHGLLADEMGLGKTLQILTLLQVSPIKRRHNLIVCPASVVPVWQSEARRWYPDLSTRILGSGNTFMDNINGEDPVLWLSSYTQLRRHKHLLENFEFGYSVLDEAQQIKNPDAKVTQACCSIRAQCRIALTGTPLENRLLDLWTLFRYLMPGLLGTRRNFESAIANENPEKRVQFEERLRSQIAPFVLRRKKDTVSRELPEKMEMDLICPITDRQRQVYRNLLHSGQETLGEDFSKAASGQAMHFFSLLTRLRQACCDPGLIPGMESDSAIEQSGKIQALMTHLADALRQDSNRKVVIFSQFVQLLSRVKPLIKEQFPKTALFELSGRTRDRAKPVDGFQNEEGSAVMLVSLRAGGTGITLHAADYVFLLDPWWNPAAENQAIDRVHRIGQRKRVFVYRMITQGTVEERIQQLKKEKRELFENTFGRLGPTSNLKAHLGKLEELAKLLT